MVHFCFSRALLRSESGVSRLFRSWGGEALYWHYEEDERVGPVLRRIGKPAIIQAALPIPSIEAFWSIGQRLLTAFLARRGVSTANSNEFQGHTHEAVHADNIIRLIRADDPEFAKLTECGSWRYPLKA